MQKSITTKSPTGAGSTSRTKKVKNAAMIAWAAGYLFLANANSVFAAGSTPGSASSSESSAVSGILDLVGSVLIVTILIGIPLIAAGAFKLVMAYRSNQPDEMSSAAKDIAIGVALIIFRAVIWPGLKDAISTIVIIPTVATMVAGLL
jgi:hypothetical protein